MDANIETWAVLLERYASYLRRRYRSVETIRTRMHYIGRLADDHAEAHPANMRTTDLQSWIDRHPWSPGTQKSARASLRIFYQWLRITDRMVTDPTADLAPVRIPQRLPRPATEEQLLAGRACGDPDVELMVRLAGNCGLRRAEIAALRREDLTPYGLRVRGKGDKERIVPIMSGHPVALAIAARPPGWLFPGRFSGHVHPATVQKWIKKATGSSPHPFRARMATKAYAGTRDVFAVQRVLGHSSVETTMAYVALSDDALMAAVKAAA